MRLSRAWGGTRGEVWERNERGKGQREKIRRGGQRDRSERKEDKKE